MTYIPIILKGSLIDSLRIYSEIIESDILIKVERKYLIYKSVNVINDILSS